MVFGPLKESLKEGMPDLSLREGLVLAPLLVLVFVLGVYPKPLLELLEPVSQRSVAYIDKSIDATQIVVMDSPFELPTLSLEPSELSLTEPVAAGSTHEISDLRR